ncbi:hypothetical protein VEGS18_A37530 [Escherichia coli]|nr:hypothetical protein VEGS18_A37530 [Escherichia coli]
MSMPLSNTLQSQIITDNHFLHHPKVDRELTRKYERARLDTENIYLLPLARGNNHNYDGKSVVEIREGANKQVISSQVDSLIKISRIWANFFPANTSNQPI